ncbi:hypothetical protein MCOR02_010733 [Pyricularia oryzae]|nr:hypothetical protein MCOR02_010733 [Pyricularia oryzae]
MTKPDSRFTLVVASRKDNSHDRNSPGETFGRSRLQGSTSRYDSASLITPVTGIRQTARPYSVSRNIIRMNIWAAARFLGNPGASVGVYCCQPLLTENKK